MMNRRATEPNAPHASTVQELARNAVLAADRNRWALFALVQFVLIAVLALAYVSLTDELNNNYRVAFVRMYANGSWDVELSELDRAAPAYLNATADSLLTHWLERRFRLRPPPGLRHGALPFYGLPMLRLAPTPD